MAWRLLLEGKKDPYLNMGTDEAILDGVSMGTSPRTLRLYMWRPSAVSIGRFQALEDSVDREACDLAGVKVVRRLTGGGAVFHDEVGEVTYSLTMKEEDLPSRDYVMSFEYMARGVVEALRLLGYRAEFVPLNDVAIGGRKVSGSAQVRRGGAVLQHGTLLLSMDKGLAFRVLKVPAQKVAERGLDRPEDRVVTLRALGYQGGAEDVMKALVQGFSSSLGRKFTEGDLTPLERRAAEDMAEKRYRSRAWLEER